MAEALDTVVYSLTLGDVFAFAEREDFGPLDEGDLHELRKRIGDGLGGDIDVVCSTALDCVELDRARRA